MKTNLFVRFQAHFSSGERTVAINPQYITSVEEAIYPPHIPSPCCEIEYIGNAMGTKRIVVSQNIDEILDTIETALARR